MTIAPQAGTLATHVVFQLNNNALTLTGGGFIPLSAGVTGLWLGTGQVLHIRATGNVAPVVGATDTLAIKLFQITVAGLASSPAPTNATIISPSGGSSLVADSGTITTAAGTSAAFSADYRLQLSSAGVLLGQFTVTVGGTVAVYAATTAIAGLGEADLNFFISLANPTGHTSSVIATLDEFALDVE